LYLGKQFIGALWKYFSLSFVQMEEMHRSANLDNPFLKTLASSYN